MIFKKALLWLPAINITEASVQRIEVVPPAGMTHEADQFLYNNADGTLVDEWLYIYSDSKQIGAVLDNFSNNSLSQLFQSYNGVDDEIDHDGVTFRIWVWDSYSVLLSSLENNYIKDPTHATFNADFTWDSATETLWHVPTDDAGMHGDKLYIIMGAYVEGGTVEAPLVIYRLIYKDPCYFFDRFLSLSNQVTELFYTDKSDASSTVSDSYISGVDKSTGGYLYYELIDI